MKGKDKSVKQIRFSVSDSEAYKRLDRNLYQFVGYEYKDELYDSLEPIYDVIENEIGGNYNNIDPQDTVEFEDCCSDIDEVWDSEEECAETVVSEYIEASGEDVDTETVLHAINVLANELGDRKNWKKSQIEENKNSYFRKINESFSWSEVDSHIEEIKDGATVVNGEIVNYDSGYQVAWHQSKEVKLESIEEVKEYVKENNLKSFGIWFEDGKYVLDTETMHVEDLETAIKIAKEANQKAIFDWKNMKKHPTLEELIKERGLKPADCEEKRRKTKNGYSYVCIRNENNTYYTLYQYPAINTGLEVILVRG
jgi:hypothetical protein